MIAVVTGATQYPHIGERFFAKRIVCQMVDFEGTVFLATEFAPILPTFPDCTALELEPVE